MEETVLPEDLGEFFSVNTRHGPSSLPTEECRPVLFGIPGTNLHLLAVRVSVPGTAALVFPLSREELGRVWEESAVPAKWKEQEGKIASWTEAWELYSNSIDYPTVFLIALL